ncbi:SDR family NAD(P)-dependent oxidoreductase [Streptomyces sp. NPDC056785]|uniref:SDR family NAD(P)-dependent oxidoreductase n=1 Tax=Streptomyces sp. NPDC056785 TaxID=3345944 RepID=UPI0036B083FA
MDRSAVGGLRSGATAGSQRKSGAVVDVGSGTSLAGVPGFAGYVAAKHGAAGLTKTAALDHGSLGIRVNAVAVGLVDTPLVATGRRQEVMAARIAQHLIGRIARLCRGACRSSTADDVSRGYTTGGA